MQHRRTRPSTSTRLPAPLPIWRGTRRRRCLAGRRARGGRERRAAGRAVGRRRGGATAGGFVGLRRLCAAPTACVWLELPLPADAPTLPRPVAALSRAPTRMQRAARRPARHRRRRRARHAALARPRRLAAPTASRCTQQTAAGELRPAATSVDYPFVRVDGDGVHEIPVGPVHAGIIEPGHFRFSVVGEKVLRLEERLGYTHKGIEKRFTELRAARGAPPGRARLGRLDGGLRLGLLHGARIGGRLRGAAARRLAARADARARARRQPPRRPRRARQRRRAGLRPGPVLAPARRLAAPVEATSSATG